MATHSSIHAWKIPWTKEPGGLQSMGSQRVRHDWATSVRVSMLVYMGLPWWLSGKESAWRHGFDPWTRISLKKEMATHSCIAWRIPWTEETNGLWASQVALVVKNLPANAGEVRDVNFDHPVGKISWRREWQPTPVFLPGESHGQRSLAGYGS